MEADLQKAAHNCTKCDVVQDAPSIRTAPPATGYDPGYECVDQERVQRRYLHATIAQGMDGHHCGARKSSKVQKVVAAQYPAATAEVRA